MLYSLLADLVVALHLAFVGFVVLGGLAVWRWPRLAWVHLPAVVWGVGIELSGAVCPLTPWENWLRHRTGDTGYQGDFIEQYLLPLLYPVGLTRTGQVVLGCIVIVVNAVAYGWVWSRLRRMRRQLQTANAQSGSRPPTLGPSPPHDLP